MLYELSPELKRQEGESVDAWSGRVLDYCKTKGYGKQTMDGMLACCMIEARGLPITEETWTIAMCELEALTAILTGMDAQDGLGTFNDTTH
jgi:hypothetical protein